ncbi:MAG: replication-associated recombination protein A [Burkholderiaceae bacterium]
MATGASDDLFSGAADAAPPATAANAHQPLAERLRPQRIEEVVGQQHLLAPGMPLRVALDSGEPHSLLFWGPPGVGKTTLARLLANRFDARFLAISAVLGGVKEIRAAIDEALKAQAGGRRTILFVDEVHRFNKAQQDAFLPHVESGLITFFGATTENPSFEVNNALLSRARVYVLQPLDAGQLRQLLGRAADHLGVQVTDEAIARLIAYADGDARRLLNAIELAARSAIARAGRPGTADEKHDGAEPTVDPDLLAHALAEDLRRFDKGGDAFYDQISALHKSVRGSDPDAALYWFCRMIDGGSDPRYLARRLVRMASEDIGLADIRALRMTLDAAETYERLGSPEGELALAEAVVFLACAAKSNRVYTAYKAAMAYAREQGSAPVPMHLRNAPTKLMKSLGHGHGYRYAHDQPDAVAKGETYFPEGLQARFYEPSDRGLEAAIADKLRRLREG